MPEPSSLLIPAFWLILCVLSSTGWNLSLRSAMKGEKDEAAASTVSNFLTIFFTLPFIFFLGAGFSFSGNSDIFLAPPIAFLALIGAALFSVVFTNLSFKASKVVEASERAIMSRMNVFWALLFAFLFLGEGISFQKILAVILIFIASGLSVYKKGEIKFHSEGIQLVILASAFSAAVAITSKFGVGYMPPLIFALLESILLTLGLYLLIGKDAISRCIGIWKRKQFDMLVNGIAGASFYASALVAYTMLPASVVVPVLATAVVLTAILGGLLLGEKEGWVRKIAGAIIALIGIIILSGA